MTNEVTTTIVKYIFETLIQLNIRPSYVYHLSLSCSSRRWKIFAQCFIGKLFNKHIISGKAPGTRKLIKRQIALLRFHANQQMLSGASMSCRARRLI